MNKTTIIKRRYEFKNLYTKGQRYFSRNITLYILKNKYDHNRFAIAVSKKCGKAVKRNKIKRIIRENYKNFEEKIITGSDILISVSKNIESDNVDFYEIQKELYSLFNKANLLVKEDEKNND